MSQGPVASSSASTQDVKPQILPPRESRTLPPITDSYRPGPAARPVILGPASTQDAEGQRPQTASGPDQRHSRPIGVQNLLNPTSRDSTDGQHRRQAGDSVDYRSSAIALTPRMTPVSSSQSPTDFSLPSITPPTTSVYPLLTGQASRRILTPRSLSAYASNASTRNLPRAMIDARTSPFIGARDRTGLDGPHVPESSFGPILPGVPYGYPLALTRSPSGRRASGGSLRMQDSTDRRDSAGAVSQPAISHSDSPGTSYSSYSRLSRSPPAANTNLPGTQPSSSTYFGTSYNAPGSASGLPQISYEVKDAYSPSTSSVGQSTYHLMTLDTEQGPIQVPVDVQAASKVADEKRKRNATASHRFRQRRKEKERETSTNIAKLEHQIRGIAEEREFYRMERDYFRGIASSIPGHGLIAPRPPSPRQIRHAQLNATGPFGNSKWHDPGESSRGGRNTRRRTSAYIPASGPPPQAIAPPPPTSYPQVSTSVSGNPELRPSIGNRTIMPGNHSLSSGSFEPSPPAHGWKSGP